MKALKFSEAQIGFVLEKADDEISIGGVRHKRESRMRAFYILRKGYGGLMSSEMARLRRLEEEIDGVMHTAANRSF